MYNILLNNGCKNSENVIYFKEQCIKELEKYGLYTVKSI